MGICLNPGNDDFKRAINSKIYVDKSMLISYTNSVLKTEQRFVFVSRPVKFGKTMAANMLTAYYSKGCDSRELFSNLKISKDESFEKHLNKYNVIRLNMARFISGEQNVDNVIDKINQKIIKELKKAFPDVDYYDDTKLVRSLKDIFSEKLISFVFIIDEWDSVIVKFKDDKESQKRYVDYLTYLLKDKSYVALAYMTGILPIKKFGTHSGLDMFYEYTMTNQRKLAEFTGFTENEVAELCDKYNMPFDEFKRWYGSYIIDGISIYNPRSVVEAIIDNSFNNYWVQTMNYYVLRDYISSDYDELREKIVKMIEGESVKVTTRTFQNDMTTFKSADDVLTLLVHLGYLTFDFDTKMVSIPNTEVQQEFINSIEDGGWETIVDSIHKSEDLLNATLNCNEEKVAEFIEQAHQDNTSILKYNDENSLSCVVSIAYYAARKNYVMHRELPSGKGFADLVFVPRRNCNTPAFIVELKRNESAEKAVQQIETKNYADALKDYKGEVILVGINYDSDKHHTCKIEKIEI